MSAESDWIPLEEAAPPRRRAPGARDVLLRSASELDAQSIKWLWRPYFPLGKLSVVAGPAGQGKSQLMTMLAGGVSTGDIHPSDLRGAADVVMVSAEDDPNDTIAPRLMAVGADLKRINILDVREADHEGSMIEAALSLPSDGAAFRRAMAKRSVKCIIIDPISSFFDAATDTHRNASVRQALSPLKALAEVTGAAVICVTHLNKNGAGGEPLDRVIESTAFTAMARSVTLFSSDPADEEGTRGSHKVFLIMKSNLAKSGEHALKVEIEDATVRNRANEPIATSRTIVTGKTDLTARDLLMPPDERSEQAEIQGLIRDVLDGAWLPSTVVKKAAMAHCSLKVYRSASEGFAKRKAPGTKFGVWWIGAKGTKPPWEEDPTWTPNGSGPVSDDEIEGNGHRSPEAYEVMQRMLGERDD
jgi:hypothetical protein